MTMYEVKDNKRTLKFDGVLLAFSTSFRPGVKRWIEFGLYRTTGGSYVLSRVGETHLFHDPSCAVAERNGLTKIPRAALREGSVPCEVCRPNDPGNVSSEIVSPEMPRYWAQVSDTAEAVVDSLYKYDEAGARYLTGVAERLLEEASQVDPAIEAAYRVETIF
jgi:hypothetical protein